MLIFTTSYIYELTGAQLRARRTGGVGGRLPGGNLTLGGGAEGKGVLCEALGGVGAYM
jgi:hypothetical protein